MKRLFICSAILLLATTQVGARTVKLTLYPAQVPEPVQKYRLLPKADDQYEADALPLYKRATESLPPDFQKEKIRQWVKTPLRDLPTEQVTSTLRRLSPTIQLVEQAGLCTECEWPVVQPGQALGELTGHLSTYREIAFILALRARLQIVQGEYDQAILTLQTGLAMARHLGTAPTLVQGLVGVAIASLMCQQGEQLVQAPDGPNVYWALQNLPKPFIDVNRQIQIELDNLRKYENPTLRKQFEEQVRPAHERVRLIAKRLDRDIAALQCVEALRLCAAANNGKFPNELSDIAEVAVPENPAAGKPFVYRGTGSKAVLEAPAPQGGKAKETIRYDLNLKE